MAESGMIGEKSPGDRLASDLELKFYEKIIRNIGGIAIQVELIISNNEKFATVLVDGRITPEKLSLDQTMTISSTNNKVSFDISLLFRNDRYYLSVVEK